MENTPKGKEPYEAPLDQLVARLRLPSDLGGRVVNVLLLVAVSFCAAYFASLGFGGSAIPHLGPEDIGRPYVGPGDLKAERDYEIVDVEATARRRTEARTQVRAVFDSNPAVEEGLAQSVARAFAAARAALVPVEPALGAAEGPGGDPSAAPEGAPAVAEGQPPATLDDARRQLVQEAFLAGFGQGNAPRITATDWRALFAAEFGPALEQGLLELIAHAFRQPIVAARTQLVQDASGGEITVRNLRTGEEQTRSIVAPTVLDLSDARAELDRYASVPGNLLPDAPTAARRVALRLARELLRPDLTINSAESEARREAAAQSVRQVVTTLKKGQKVVDDGELITARHVALVEGMREGARGRDSREQRFGSTALTLLLIAACYGFFRVAFRRFRPARRDALMMGALLIALLGLAHLSVGVAAAVNVRYPEIPPAALHYAIPLAAGAMVVRFILSVSNSLLFAIVISVLGGILLDGSLSFGLYVLIGSLVGAERISHARDRVGVLKAAAVTGALNGVTVFCLRLAEGQGLGQETLTVTAFAWLGATLTLPLVVLTVVPLFERLWGYASDLRLQELANLNHPALKEMVVQAPGTYHHSIVLGSLVEPAAEAIGADPLLARTCAYYHDIGKVKNPRFFSENQKGSSRHDGLAPAMSAVIIKRHVTDGLEAAAQYRLPKLVADAVVQHHGTRTVTYFYRKAQKELEARGGGTLDESIYRYPGPKPQFREVALVMIADEVEAACRALAEPTLEELETQIDGVINHVFTEGQLDECELTLKDLHLIADSLLQSLAAFHHARPAASLVGGSRPPAAGNAPGARGGSAPPVPAVKSASGTAVVAKAGTPAPGGSSPRPTGRILEQ